MRRTAFNVILGTMILAASAATAFSQPAPPAPPASPTLIVEEIQNGWLLSPDMRATDLNGKTGALAGGYLGRMTDRSWVIGVGGYVLTNREDDFKLWYGGPVFEWLIRADRKIGFGVRTLVGVGSGTLARPLSDFISPRAMPMPGGREDRRGTSTRPTLREVNPDATIAVQDDFFVAEPQINMMWNLSAGQRIVFGVGYRAVGNAPYLGDDLRGLSGSVAFQLGGK
jgi:hypothetical protein